MLLETKRLLIREFNSQDLQDLASILGDPQVMEFSLKGPLTIKQTKDFFQKKILKNYSQYGFGLWAIVRKDDERLIGFTGIITQHIDNEDVMEIGYRILPQDWGQGFATEASLAVKEYAFNHLGLDHLISIIDPRNIRSAHVAKKLGMKVAKKTNFHGFDVDIYEVFKS